MRIDFTVEFDSEAWDAMGEDQRAEWISEVADAIDAEARVVRIGAVELSGSGSGRVGQVDKWIIEIGVDDQGEREHIVDVAAGPSRDAALTLARAAQGRTVADVLDWVGADLIMMPTGGDSMPIAGVSVVYYDGEGALSDTRIDIDF